MRKHWSQVLQTDWPWKHFTPEEMACKHCGQVDMHSATMNRLERLRTAYAAALHVSSAYRCPEHPIEAKKSRDGRKLGVHTHGRAIDLLLHGPNAQSLIFLAINAGFTGLGIQQKGDNSVRFIHIDDTTDSNFTRPTIWSY